MANKSAEITFPSVITSDVSLSNLIDKSRVLEVGTADGYDEKIVRKLLAEDSLGMYLYYEVLFNLANDSNFPPYDFFKECFQAGKHPAVLGIDAPSDDHEVGAYAIKSHPWRKGYEELGIDVNDPDRTEKYMNAITDPDGLHVPIVFVVPGSFQKLFNGTETETYREFKYLLEHPDRAKNVLFIFGDDLVNDVHPSLVGRTQYERYQIIMKALSMWMSYALGEEKKSVDSIK